AVEQPRARVVDAERQHEPAAPRQHRSVAAGGVVPLEIRGVLRGDKGARDGSAGRRGAGGPEDVHVVTLEGVVSQGGNFKGRRGQYFPRGESDNLAPSWAVGH